MKKIYIEVSDICHLACSFCTPEKSIRKEMEVPLFESLCLQIQEEFKSCILSLHILGDPCYRKDLPLLCQIAQKYNLKIDLVTTGYYKIPTPLLSMPNIHQISFSLDSYLDKNNPKNESYIRNILSFCLDHKNLNSSCFINFRLQDRTLLHAMKYPKSKSTQLLKELLEKIFQHFEKPKEELERLFSSTHHPLDPSFKNQNPQHLIPQNSISSQFINFYSSKRRMLYKISLAQLISLNFFRSFQWNEPSKNLIPPKISPHKSIPVEKKLPKTPYCQGCLSQLGILADGRVVPCCLDSRGDITLGNTKNQTLKEILNSPLVEKIKIGFKNGIAIHPLCQNCNFANPTFPGNSPL